jgi:hypothetical protein
MGELRRRQNRLRSIPSYDQPTSTPEAGSIPRRHLSRLHREPQCFPSLLLAVDSFQQLLNRHQKVALVLDRGANVVHEGAPACNRRLCLAILWLTYAVVGRFERRRFATERLEPFVEDADTTWKVMS